MTALYQLQNIEQRYGDRLVLRISDFTVHAGECLSIVGPSGAGKSTLLRLLGFIQQPASGELRYEGKRFDRDPPLEIRREITMVFQRPQLLDTSVFNNVAYGLKIRGQVDPEHVDTVLKQLGLFDLKHQPALSLSGGELQRAAVARALVLRPRVLLLDEPTANLDPANVNILEAAMDTVRAEHGTTVVLVTHNLHQVRRLADRVGVMMDGELIECDSAQRVMRTPADPRTQEFITGGMIY